MELFMTYELRAKAKELRSQQNYTEALPIYQKLWEEENNKWDGWGYAFCLRKNKNFKDAIKVCEKVLEIDETFDYIKNIYSWTLFDYLNSKELNIETYKKIVEKILSLTTEDDLIYSKAIFKYLNKLKEKSIYPSDEILSYLEKLTPEKLSKEAYSFTQNNKKIELAPEFEQYFMYKTKALLEKGLFEECIETSYFALNKLTNFHYSNDIWFKWRIALSYKGLNNYDDSLKILLEIYKIKKEWFIEKELAEIYLKINEVDKALKFALKGIMNFGEIDKKIHLIILLVEIFDKKSMISDAKLHFNLAKTIIDENDWKINLDDKFIKKYQELEYSTSKEIFKKLRPIWKDIYYSNSEKFTGNISKIMPNGKSGFVSADNGKSYYFKIKDFNGKKDNLKEGKKIEFYLEDSFDFKKNKSVKNAVNISLC
jgi:tetratricopeptide (TPR) repeat protein